MEAWKRILAMTAGTLASTRLRIPAIRWPPKRRTIHSHLRRCRNRSSQGPCQPVCRSIASHSCAKLQIARHSDTQRRHLENSFAVLSCLHRQRRPLLEGHLLKNTLPTCTPRAPSLRRLLLQRLRAVQARHLLRDLKEERPSESSRRRNSGISFIPHCHASVCPSPLNRSQPTTQLSACMLQVVIHTAQPHLRTAHVGS